MNWHLKQLLTPKLGGPYHRFMKTKTTDENESKKKQEAQQKVPEEKKDCTKRDR